MKKGEKDPVSLTRPEILLNTLNKTIGMYRTKTKEKNQDLLSPLYEIYRSVILSMNYAGCYF